MTASRGTSRESPARKNVFGSDKWNTFRTAWEVALKRANLDNFRFHDLRHTFASWLIQRARSPKEVQEPLGHRTIAMTMRYSHLGPDHLRAPVAALDNVLPLAPNATAQERHLNEEPADPPAGSPAQPQQHQYVSWWAVTDSNRGAAD